MMVIVRIVGKRSSSPNTTFLRAPTSFHVRNVFREREWQYAKGLSIPLKLSASIPSCHRLRGKSFPGFGVLDQKISRTFPNLASCFVDHDATTLDDTFTGMIGTDTSCKPRKENCSHLADGSQSR
ncbi:hypothetical protein PM082_007235 [Marasmius tenuissimus]|nr:hypothetical protein PM082_007235 [Marasmius tenuissimus]